jgi:signal transduction histidine kinase/CheY-like chemotaxis protein
MDIMANAVGVDRVCIWRKNDESRLCLSLNYQWENNYFKSLKENGILTPDIYFDSHPVWNEVLLKGDCINSLVRDMPPAEQAELKHRNILSIFVVPVFLQEEQFWGYIGFDNCKRECIFTNSEVMILRSASRMIAHAIIRSEMTMQLENTAIIANNANKSKSSFLANMSHEIRTPMNAILGIAEIQLRDEILSAETEEAIRKIYESGDLLLNIINDILDLSKIEAGKLELVPIKYDIPSLVNDSVQLNRLRYDSKPIELLIFVDENTPQYLIGDELRIKQVLNNILSNAFKYTDEGTIEFHISAETEQNNNNDNVMINFRIIDTGHGMTAIQIHNLFDEYTRFNAEANRETIGTGLGMSITKHLVDLMKGGITVKSELGKGTEFTVRIPQKRVGSEVCGNELSDKLRNFNFRSTTLTNKTQFLREYMPYGSVLVVDDVESNIYVIKGMLLPYGIKIDAVSSGFDAIKKIEEGNVYDIIFMDHMMPKLDGIETVKKIRGLGYKHTIVALTANALIGRAEMFLQNGFDGFISKPIDSRELNLMLNELIRNKKPAEVIEAVRYFAYKNKGNAAAEAAQKELVSEELIAAAVHDVENAFEVLDDLLLGINLGKVNIDLFYTTVHGINSAFANIGEKQLSDFALRLEQAGEKRDTTAISIDISGFMYSLQAFLSKHKKSPSKKDDNNQQGVSDDDIVFLKEKLNGIKTACAKFNQKDAKTALNEIKRKIWSQKTSDIINDISLYLIRGEYEKVESAIDEAMNGEI